MSARVAIMFSPLDCPVWWVRFVLTLPILRVLDVSSTPRRPAGPRAKQNWPGFEMRAYLAASYRRKEQIRAAADYLESIGVEIISDWHKEIYSPIIDIRDLSYRTNQGVAVKDCKQVQQCDTLIFWSEDPNVQPPRGGRHVEFGIALALGKRIIIVGKRENIFHFLPQVNFIEHVEDIRVDQLRGGN
jgi:hypothetical protein